MEQENKFSVAIHYGDTLGYIEYDGDAHKAVGQIIVLDAGREARLNVAHPVGERADGRRCGQQVADGADVRVDIGGKSHGAGSPSR